MTSNNGIHSDTQSLAAFCPGDAQRMTPLRGAIAQDEERSFERNFGVMFPNTLIGDA